MRHDEFCERLVESVTGGGKMLHQVTQPQHEDEEHSSSPEPEARLIVMSGRNGRSGSVRSTEAVGIRRASDFRRKPCL